MSSQLGIGFVASVAVYKQCGFLIPALRLSTSNLKPELPPFLLQAAAGSSAVFQLLHFDPIFLSV